MSKALIKPTNKIKSPPLSKEEIRDIKLARKSKGKLYTSAEECVQDLHRYVANHKKDTI